MAEKTYPSDPRAISCPICDGNGEVEIQQSPLSPVQISPDYKLVPCKWCGGSGEVVPGEDEKLYEYDDSSINQQHP